MKVTVYTCTYNAPDLLIRAADSVPRHQDIEYIVVNDGSTDNTLEVLREYQKTFPEMKIISYPENKGLGHAKNKAYEAATGDYIYQLDHDDYLYTDEFMKAVGLLDGSDMVYVNLRINNGDVWHLNEVTQSTFVAGTTHFTRREFMKGLRTREDTWTEDYYFYCLLMSKHPTIKYTDLTVYHYNFPREGSILWILNRGLDGKGL